MIASCQTCRHKNSKEGFMKKGVIVALGLAVAGFAQAQGLPKLNINPQEVSLTGLSSGGYMAVQ